MNFIKRVYCKNIIIDESNIREYIDEIENGTVIKSYPDDTPYPSRLILGFDGQRPVHVVSAYNSENDTEYVITVYEPDALKWSDDFTERR